MTKIWPPRSPGGVRPNGLLARPRMRSNGSIAGMPLLLAFVAQRVPSSDCDDLHQEVWQRVWASLPENYQSNNLRAWLHQIARNAIIDLSRKSMRCR